jgi:hypothetical protein
MYETGYVSWAIFPPGALFRLASTGGNLPCSEWLPYLISYGAAALGVRYPPPVYSLNCAPRDSPSATAFPPPRTLGLAC